MQIPAATLEQFISKQRLDSYKGYWGVSPDIAADLYMWNSDVSSKMSKLLCFMEVPLRNRIHSVMSLSISRGRQTSIDWWTPLWSQLKGDARSRITEILDKAHPTILSPDEVVARLSFGFWPNILSWIAKQRSRLMVDIFPNHPLSAPRANPNWSSAAARNDAIQVFFEFKDIRNRIAHHEPLWKFSAVSYTSPHHPHPTICIAPASTNPSTTFSRFQRLLRLYDQAILALSPTLHAYLKASSWLKKIEFLLSTKGVSRYMNGGHVLRKAMSTKSLHQQFASVASSNSCIQVFAAGGGGVFIPD